MNPVSMSNNGCVYAMWRDGLAERLSRLLARERTALAEWRHRTSQQQPLAG